MFELILFIINKANSNVQPIEPQPQTPSTDYNQTLFIGKRESRTIQIETYQFKNNQATHMSNTNSSNNTKKKNKSQSQQKAANPELVANAMTMQKALETAYNDWNREKVEQEQPVVADQLVSDGSNSIKNDENVVSEKSPTVTKKGSVEQTVTSEDQATSEIAYYFGNPTVDLVKGFIHIYKDW